MKNGIDKRSLSSLAVFAAVFAWVALAAVHPAARAQDKRVSIAVVDVQAILQNSAASKNLREQMEKIRADYQAAVRKREQALRKESEDLQRQRAVLSPDSFAQKRREYEAVAHEAQTAFRDRKRQIDRAYGIALGKINQMIVLSAARISEKRFVDLVLPKSVVILSDRKLDITKEVLASVNKELSSVSVALPEFSEMGRSKK